MSKQANAKYFHFTIGPVQGFVAQARRTRDFWAGSFLLSWLSAVAMLAVEQQEGEILFPKPDPVFTTAMVTGGKGPKQGTIPNRFKASVPDGFDARLVESAVLHAWTALAQRIYEADLQGVVGPSSITKEIWDRQIQKFWEMSWAITPDANDTSIINQLKNWRCHLPPDEGGVKCMMMEGWQELSGVETPHREGLGGFWKKVRESGASKIQTDLREKEHLCAIAFVKRRFVRHFEHFTTEIPDGGQVKGWELPAGIPSVAYMAAAPWLAKLLTKTREDPDLAAKVKTFHAAACDLTGAGKDSEQDSNISCVKEAVAKGNPEQKKWAALDGTVFFDAMLENPYLWDAKQRKDAEKVLVNLDEVRKAADLEPVSPFYAVLLMDGDQLGIQMREPKKSGYIASGLAAFTKKVQEIVEKENDGFLIYAGGDDVLALLTLEHALPCAASLRAHYASCFAPYPDITTSISGAIEYAHIKMPLGKVLRDAHALLDKVAKEGRGRDAIACRVWKPGGLAVEWAMPWEYALENGNGPVVLETLGKKLQAAKGKTDPAPEASGQTVEESDRFSGKFFFKIRERFALLNPEKSDFLSSEELLGASPKYQPPLTPNQAVSLMAAEYIASGVARTKSMAEARQIIEPLLEQCRPVRRDQEQTDCKKWRKSTCLDADGALLVRFLAQKGVER